MLFVIPTEEVVVDLPSSLPPQMAPYLKTFLAAGRPADGITAESFYRMKISMTNRSPEALAPRMKFLPGNWRTS